MASSDDTEITLGAGKLLGLFFLLAAICGVFFSIGYSLGKSSGREQAANDQAQVSASAEPSSTTTMSADKPSAGLAKPQQRTSSDDTPAANDDNKLTFYKAVQQSGTESEEQPKTTKTGKSETAIVKTTADKSLSKTDSRASADVISHTLPVTGPGTIVVQIAALSREDDAVSLAGALRKKNYNVFVVNNPVTNDKFYHVQVGPFTTVAEAEATKTKLVAEGYNPIIKR